MSSDKSPGQIAYEEDCRRYPVYHDGGKRPEWCQLDPLFKANWEKYPTPRQWSNGLHKSDPTR